MRALIVGDSHGNIVWLRNIYDYAFENNIDLILQLGDFGYWEHTRNGHWFLTKVNKSAIDYNIPFYWIDGNHENHTLLRKKYEDNPKSDSDLLYGKFTHTSLCQIRSHLFYMPRGSIHSLLGINFMAFGGSYSIDINSRVPGKSWWPEEMPTTQELNYAIQTYVDSNLKIDVLLSHDTIYEGDMVQLLHGGAHATVIPKCEQVRKTVSSLAKTINPKYLFHGHYHRPCNYEVYLNNNLIRCISLGSDRDSVFNGTYILNI